jgi:hypothetical protein
MEKFGIDFIFDGEVAFDENKEIRSEDKYKDVLKVIEGMLRHSETISKITIKIPK